MISKGQPMGMTSPGSGRRAGRSARGRGARSFTIVELIVVVTIIGILLGMVLPAASKMWAQRNEAATYNMLRGLLESARTQAIRAGERGLFFFLDEDGTQRVVFIRGEPPEYSGDGRDACNCNLACCTGTCTPVYCLDSVETVDRFRVMIGQMYTIPKPYRVAPDWAIDPAKAPRLSVAQFQSVLERRRFQDANGNQTPYYQRNFFTVIFNNRGEIVTGRNVLIHDFDYVDQPATDADGQGNGRGDATTLPVSQAVDRYWDQAGDLQVLRDAGVAPSPDGLFDMILSEDAAANFASVAGLVVYNETELEGLDGAGIWDVLKRTGQPCFVSRYTGEVVFGKKGS